MRRHDRRRRPQDDVLVTETGVQNIRTACPRTYDSAIVATVQNSLDIQMGQ
jgi:hypothetical protein